MSLITYRTLSRSDIQAGLRLCRLAHWNQLAADWELFLTLSPQGCRAAVSDDQVVGTVTTVNFQDCFAWVGMVLVDPGYRGHGIGTRLLTLSVEILEGVPAVRLDATPQGKPVYERMGFVAEYELSRMQIELTSDSGVPSSVRTIPLGYQDLEKVLEMDQQVFGADRGPLLDWALARAPEYAWVVKGDSGVEGYCFGRHGYAFEQIGPVVAHQQEVAEQLVVSCLRGNAGKKFILDPPCFSADWLQWLSQVGFLHQRPFTRMCFGEIRHPGIPQKQWAIFGPEVG